MFYFRLKHVFARFALFWDVLGELKKNHCVGWGLASGSRLERRTGTVIVTVRKFLDEKKN